MSYTLKVINKSLFFFRICILSLQNSESLIEMFALKMNDTSLGPSEILCCFCVFLYVLLNKIFSDLKKISLKKYLLLFIK